jgi:hypothetical protein
MSQLKDSLLTNVASENESSGDNRHFTQNQSHQQYKKQLVELEALHISIGKRIYSQIDVIVMFLNTMTAVFSISAAVSLIPQYDYSQYTFCDYGPPIAIGVQCPYLPSPVFISFFIAWILYFFSMMTYKWFHTYEYWSNDLRFYIACDSLHNTFPMKCFIYIGMILTIVSTIGGIVYVFHNGSTSSLGSIFVFASVNLYNLSKMMSSRIKTLLTLNLERDFPHPIHIRLPLVLTKNHIDGIILNHNEVFEYLYQLITVAALTGKEEPLMQFGDSTQLREVALLLVPPDLK